MGVADSKCKHTKKKTFTTRTEWPVTIPPCADSSVSKNITVFNIAPMPRTQNAIVHVDSVRSLRIIIIQREEGMACCYQI